MNKFNWSNLPPSFVKAVVFSKNTIKEDQPNLEIDDVDLLSPFIEGIATRPGKTFCTKYRAEIESNLIELDPNLTIKAYNKINRTNICAEKLSEKQIEDLYMEIVRKPKGNLLINSYINILTELGGKNSEFDYSSEYRNPVSLNLQKIEVPKPQLYYFQNDAINALEKSFVTGTDKSGLLVMPTGSGKTRTAVYFLLSKMISDGYQVIWLTHRHMLVDQPADAFVTFSAIANAENPDLKVLNIACVSGEHSSIRKTTKKHNVMILSVQSTCRSLEYLRSSLGSKIIIVVDEAHHTIAASYRKIIAFIRKHRENALLLGLTATPVRINQKDSDYLMQQFNHNIIYSIDMSTLISKGILATPINITVETDYVVKTSIDDEKYIQKWGEAHPALVDRIAHSCERNKTIVDHYMNNREQYGKTLIFALNAFHCISLCEDLKAKGIKCDYVYSGHEGNSQKIDRFKNGKLDVLVNINILTEGADVPDIQTIFLTRPTTSEVLLMQMIGRGLRGPQAGGTETLNVVDFVDQWGTFTKWLNPEWEINKEKIIADYEEIKKSQTETATIPWEVCRDIYHSITYNYLGDATEYKILPMGWYALLDEDGNDKTVLVFEDQIDGYLSLSKNKKLLLKDDFTVVKMRDYFKGFSNTPTDEELSWFLADVREDNMIPHFYTFKERKEIDPIAVAQKIRNAKMPVTDIMPFIKDIFDNNEIVSNIYEKFDNYHKRVIDCIWPPVGIIPLGSKIVEMPSEQIPFDTTPLYNLESLVQEVKNEMFGGVYDVSVSFEWTDKCYRGYYGQYNPNNKVIKINKIINSKDVPKEVVKFIIYHEMLHNDNLSHNKSFRDKEHLYPEYAELEKFLDGKFEGFDLDNVWRM